MKMEKVSLSSIAEINPAKNKEDFAGIEEVSFIPMKSVDDRKGEVVEKEIVNIKKVIKGYTSFKDGDVLFAKITPCMENGKCAVVTELKNGIGFGSTEFYVIRPRENVLSEYIWLFLRQEKIRKMAKQNFTGASGHKRVPKNFIENLKIPMPMKDGKPDIEEQRKIMNRNFEIFNALDGAVVSINYSLDKTGKLLESKLESIFSNPSFAFESVRIKNSTEIEKGKKPEFISAKKEDNYKPYLIANYFRSKQIKQFGSSGKAKLVRKNDLLMIWDGSNSGDVFISDIDGILSSTMIKINSKIDTRFLYYFLKYNFSLLNSKTTGSGIPHISKYIFNNLEIPLPIKNGKISIGEQKRIAKEINAVSKVVELLREKYEEQLNNFLLLKQSILQQAFTGELVKEEVIKPNFFGIQQVLATLLQKYQRGEMVLAKMLFFTQEIYKAKLNIPFSPQNFGPYDVAVKKALMAGLSTKNKFFCKMGGHYALGERSGAFLKYGKSNVVKCADNFINDTINDFSNPNVKDSDIERLATVCEIIKNNKTTDFDLIMKELIKWKGDREDFSRAFSEDKIKSSIKYILSKEWDKELIR